MRRCRGGDVRGRRGSDLGGQSEVITESVAQTGSGGSAFRGVRCGDGLVAPVGGVAGLGWVCSRGCDAERLEDGVSIIVSPLFIFSFDPFFV